MQKIAPFKNIHDALRELDNGGRFFNFFTKANDGIVTAAEVNKAAGIFNDAKKLALFLELSASGLHKWDREKLFSKLDKDVLKHYEKHQPEEINISDFKEKGEKNSLVIVSGTPKLTDSTTKITGFIMIPIVAGDVTTFTQVPLSEHFDIYELVSDDGEETFLISHVKSKVKLPEKKIKLAGVVKELKKNKKEEAESDRFLDVLYYMDI